MKKSSVVVVAISLSALPVQAERISNPVAVFSGLDKVSGEITTLEVKIDEEVRFGTLIVRPRVCYSRPVTEEPKTSTFAEIDDVDVQGEATRVFTGWMFAESPALHALEHPVYDVWLVACKDPAMVAPKLEKTPAQPVPDSESIPKDND